MARQFVTAHPHQSILPCTLRIDLSDSSSSWCPGGLKIFQCRFTTFSPSSEKRLRSRTLSARNSSSFSSKFGNEAYSTCSEYQRTLEYCQCQFGTSIHNKTPESVPVGIETHLKKVCEGVLLIVLWLSDRCPHLPQVLFPRLDEALQGCLGAVSEDKEQHCSPLVGGWREELQVHLDKKTCQRASSRGR